MSVDARSAPATGWAGTLAYLAPEQIRGERRRRAAPTSTPSGCVLFHALAGRPPFAGDDEQAVLDAHLHPGARRGPSDVVPGLPPALDEVVRRAMAKRPEDRFATAGELGRAALAARYDVALLARRGRRAAPRRDRRPAPGGGPAAAGDRGRGARAPPPRASAPPAPAPCSSAAAGLGDWAREGLAAAQGDRRARPRVPHRPGAAAGRRPSPVTRAWPSSPTTRGSTCAPGVGDALAVDDLVRALRGADVGPGLAQPPGDVCPYRGLEAFREEDADLYFGREQDVARLVERLRAHAASSPSLGPSGSGKSSLVQAGLLPALRRGALAGGESGASSSLVPGRAAARRARRPAAPTCPARPPPPPPTSPPTSARLDLATARALEGRPADDRVLLVVDQLEEAFTLCQDEGERAAFLGNLVYAATIPGGRTVVVVADARRLLPPPRGAPRAARRWSPSQQVLLGPLDARGLRRAIEEPARRGGLELEPGLTRRILTDVADRPGTLPLMEHLLLEVWQRRRGRTLTLEAYAASGGVEGALARRANDDLRRDEPRAPGGRPARAAAPHPARRGHRGHPPARHPRRAGHPPGRGGRGRRRRRRAGRGPPADDGHRRGHRRAGGRRHPRGPHPRLARAARLDQRRPRAAAPAAPPLRRRRPTGTRGGRDDGQLYRGARLARLGGPRRVGPQRAGAGLPRREPRAGRAGAGDPAHGAPGSPSARWRSSPRSSPPSRSSRSSSATTPATSATSPRHASSPAARRWRASATRSSRRCWPRAPTRPSPTVEAEESLRQGVHDSKIRAALRPPDEPAADRPRCRRARANRRRDAVGHASGSGTPAKDPRGASPSLVGRRGRAGISALAAVPAGYVTGGEDGALVLWPGRDAPGAPERIARVPGRGSSTCTPCREATRSSSRRTAARTWSA